MISDNAVGSINAIDILCTKLASVWTCTAKFLNLDQYWVKDVCIIVGQPVLDDRDDTFETHASVHMFRWKSFEGSVFLSVKLDKDVVPYFDDCRVVTIDKMGNLTTTYSIDMHFTVIVIDMDYNE